MRQFQSGDLVQHFKRELVDTSQDPNAYLYEIVGTATHSETREDLMIYRACYGDQGLFARPLSMFMAEVDRSKYPDIQQVYRFEKVVADGN